MQAMTAERVWNAPVRSRRYTARFKAHRIIVSAEVMDEVSGQFRHQHDVVEWNADDREHGLRNMNRDGWQVSAVMPNRFIVEPPSCWTD